MYSPGLVSGGRASLLLTGIWDQGSFHLMVLSSPRVSSQRKKGRESGGSWQQLTPLPFTFQRKQKLFWYFKEGIQYKRLDAKVLEGLEKQNTGWVTQILVIGGSHSHPMVEGQKGKRCHPEPMLVALLSQSESLLPPQESPPLPPAGSQEPPLLLQSGSLESRRAVAGPARARVHERHAAEVAAVPAVAATSGRALPEQEPRNLHSPAVSAPTTPGKRKNGFSLCLPKSHQRLPRAKPNGKPVDKEI